MSLSIEIAGVRLEVRGLAGLLTLAGLALVAGAVRDQMHLPPGQRSWHGTLWGRVPYDFRLPTLARVARTLWDPASDRVVADKMFGVGWDVNFSAVAKRLGLVH